MTPTNHPLDKDSVKRLLKRNPDGNRDDTMSRRCLCDVFRIDGNRALLVFEDGRGRLYDSFDDFVKFIDDASNQAKRPISFLPHPERFRTDVLALIEELPALLAIDKDALDFCEDSLRTIDDAIRRVGAQRIMSPEIFPSLVAYVGEVIRRQVNGAWELRSPVGSLQIEPEIVDPTGDRYYILHIYKELLERGNIASMHAFVKGALSSHRFRPKH